jgi:hypothetical protein
MDRSHPDYGEVFVSMDAEVEEFPRLSEALAALGAAEYDDDVPYRGGEFRITAGGQVIYRLYPRDGADYEGGAVTIA